MKLTLFETVELIEKYIPHVSEKTKQNVRHLLRRLPRRRALALQRLARLTRDK